MNCENCGKPSDNKLCPSCLQSAIHDFDNESCHNCDAKCKGCEPYHFEDDETKVYNDLNEAK